MPSNEGLYPCFKASNLVSSPKCSASRAPGGYGDCPIVADIVFPLGSTVQGTAEGNRLRVCRPIRPEAARTILSIYPLETFVDDFVSRMAIIGTQQEVAPDWDKLQATLR